jgi:hypothetical protein
VLKKSGGVDGHGPTSLVLGKNGLSKIWLRIIRDLYASDVWFLVDGLGSELETFTVQRLYLSHSKEKITCILA